MSRPTTCRERDDGPPRNFEGDLPITATTRKILQLLCPCLTMSSQIRMHPPIMRFSRMILTVQLRRVTHLRCFYAITPARRAGRATSCVCCLLLSLISWVGLIDMPEDKRESLYICSASIGPYLRHWAKGVGIAPDHVLATEMAVESHDGKESMSGLLHGYNVWGSNKVRRISDTFAPQSVRILESYGDTRGDREMLHAAQASFFRPFRV